MYVTFAKTADVMLNVGTAMQGIPPAEALDRVQGKIVPLGQRFHGSDSSFPFSSYSVSTVSAVSEVNHDRTYRSSSGRVPVS
jgi:hypothetical protein